MREIGIYSYFGYPPSFDARLNMMKDAGFEATSIGLGQEEELVKSGEKEVMPELVRSKGLFIEYVHAPDDTCNNLWSESEQSRSEIKKEYRSYIAFCERHNIPMLVMHISKSKGEQATPCNRYGLRIMRELRDNGEPGFHDPHL